MPIQPAAGSASPSSSHDPSSDHRRHATHQRIGERDAAMRIGLGEHDEEHAVQH
jgi:hypothetical protein